MIHRMLGHVDRAATREDGPIPVVLATEGRKADGIDLRMAGARLERFQSNPVLGYGHSYWSRDDLPIGRVEGVAVDGTTLRGGLVFDRDDPFAANVERKMRGKYLNAVSIGFSVAEWEDGKGDYRSGGVATAWELSELSVVPIGMDPHALAGRGLTCPLCGTRSRWEGEPGPELVHFTGDEPPITTPPADPEPAELAGFVVSESAARGLLAALKL